MLYNKWDVIFVPTFPNQENKTNFSPKPAIVLEVKGTKVSICPITTKLHQASIYRDTIRVDKRTPEHNSMGLRSNSLIVLDRIEEIDISRIESKFGTCHQNIRTQIGSILAKNKK